MCIRDYKSKGEHHRLGERIVIMILTQGFDLFLMHSLNKTFLTNK